MARSRTYIYAVLTGTRRRNRIWQIYRALVLRLLITQRKLEHQDVRVTDLGFSGLTRRPLFMRHGSPINKLNDLDAEVLTPKIEEIIE